MPPTSTSPSRDSPILYAAVFLMFATIGVLMMMVQVNPQGWLSALVSGSLSGLISAGWVYAFIRERWWILVPLILLPFLAPTIFVAMGRAGLMNIGMGLSPQWRLIVLAIMCVAFTSLGFILFVVHLRTSERRGARALAELELARQVHILLVPPITLSTPIAEVFGRSKPSSSMGGDLIDAVSQNGCINVLLGDVSGHGVGAGVVMAMLKSCVRTRLLHAADLSQIVTDANKVLSDLTAANMFATFAALRLRSDHTFEYALAGHLPIFHFHAASSRWDRYPNQSLPLGIDNSELFSAGSAPVAPGDILAVFTDGLMEVQNSGGRELGLDGVGRLLAKTPATSLPAIHEAVMSGVAAHGSQLDDQSLVLVRVS